MNHSISNISSSLSSPSSARFINASCCLCLQDIKEVLPAFWVPGLLTLLSGSMIQSESESSSSSGSSLSYSSSSISCSSSQQLSSLSGSKCRMAQLLSSSESESEPMLLAGLLPGAFSSILKAASSSDGRFLICGCMKGWLSSMLPIRLTLNKGSMSSSYRSRCRYLLSYIRLMPEMEFLTCNSWRIMQRSMLRSPIRSISGGTGLLGRPGISNSAIECFLSSICFCADRSLARGYYFFGLAVTLGFFRQLIPSFLKYSSSSDFALCQCSGFFARKGLSCTQSSRFLRQLRGSNFLMSPMILLLASMYLMDRFFTRNQKEPRREFLETFRFLRLLSLGKFQKVLKSQLTMHNQTTFWKLASIITLTLSGIFWMLRNPMLRLLLWVYLLHWPIWLLFSLPARLFSSIRSLSFFSRNVGLLIIPADYYYKQAKHCTYYLFYCEIKHSLHSLGCQQIEGSLQHSPTVTGDTLNPRSLSLLLCVISL